MVVDEILDSLIKKILSNGGTQGRGNHTSKMMNEILKTHKIFSSDPLNFYLISFWPLILNFPLNQRRFYIFVVRISLCDGLFNEEKQLIEYI